MTEAQTNLDPYATLELPQGASEAEIKRAFRRLALLHHPDRNPHDRDAERRFKLISAAYTYLRESGWYVSPPEPEEAPEADPAWHPTRDEELPRFWADGAPIHYPTRAEIDALLGVAASPRLLTRLKRPGDAAVHVFGRLYCLGIAVAVGTALATLISSLIGWMMS